VGVPPAQGDRFVFDPNDPDPNTPNYSPAPPPDGQGTVAVTGRGAVRYDGFEGPVVVIAAPLVTFTPPTFTTSEGSGVQLAVTVVPLGTTGKLAGPVTWDLDNDGEFGDAVGESLSLTWRQLSNFGIISHGVYTIGARATNADDLTATEHTTLTVTNAAPVVTLTGSPTGTAGTPYVLAFAATDPGTARTLQWRINWGDGTPVEVFGSTANSATHVYRSPLAAVVVAQVIDSDSAPGVAGSASLSVAVSIDPATVDAGGPYQTAEGQALTLFGTAAGDPVSYSWDVNGDGVFGDAAGQNPVLSWAQLQALIPPTNDNFPAAPRVRLQVTYAGGVQAASAVAATFGVLNTPPTAQVTASGPVNQGDSATVTVSDMLDPSNADQQAGFRFSFDFDDDGVYDIVNSTDPTAAAPTSLTRRAGIHPVRVRVTDKDNGSFEALTAIVVHDVPPTLTLTPGPGPAEGSPFTLGLSAADPGDDVIREWIVRWGDGATQVFRGPTQSPTHVYDDDGTYTVAVRAIDAGGFYDGSTTVQVGNTAPTLSNVAGGPGVEGGLTHLRGAISDPGRGDALVLTVTWGDGKQDVYHLAAGSSRFDVAHTYAAGGTYAVVVGLADDEGTSAPQVSTSISVTDVAPAVSGLGFSPARIFEGVTAVLTGSYADPGVSDAHTVVVDWGDGTTSPATVDPATRTFQATHLYRNNPPGQPTGAFQVTAAVTDGDGLSGSATTAVTVQNLPPRLTGLSLSPSPIVAGAMTVLTASFTDPGVLDTLTVLIDWGDGVTTQAKATDSTGAITAAHIYGGPVIGPPLSIKVTVRDNDGGETSGSLPIVIVGIDEPEPPPPPPPPEEPEPPPPPVTLSHTSFALVDGPLVRVFDPGSRTEEFSAHPFGESYRGPMNLAVGDVTGDGVNDLVAGAGAGGAPHVVVIDGATRQVIANFFAYGSDLRGGVWVAAGDVDGDGTAELITGAGTGGGPHVKVWDAARGVERYGFFAYVADFRGGVHVAAADLDADGLAEIITSPGAGGGPHVRVLDGRDGTGRADFMAYEVAFTGGVQLAAGDFDGDGVADLVVAPESGGAPRVRVYAGPSVLSDDDPPTLNDFFAGSPTGRKGVAILATDLGGDADVDLLASPRRDGSRGVDVYPGHRLHNGGREPDALDLPGVLGGVMVD
jgi:hypothetical protein